MKRYALSVLLVLLFALKLCAQNTGVQQFNVRTYGAKGDGTTDDTTAIQRALDAANAYTEANTGTDAIVTIPRGVYMVAGPALGAAVTVGETGESDRITVNGEGTIKMVAGDDCDYVMLVAGNYNRVEGITIDGNAAGTPTGRGEGLRVTGDYNVVEGVISQNTKTTGSTGATFYTTSSGVGNTLRDCISISSGYTAFRIGGDFDKVRNCYAINHLSHGLGTTGQDMESLDVDGFYSTGGPSSTSFSGVLLDQGVSGTTGYMIRHASLKNIVINSGAATYIPIKITRCHEVYLENVYAYHSATSSSVKLSEDIGKLVIKDSYFSRNIDQDQSPQDPSGAVTAVADPDLDGFANFTSTSHGLKTNAYIVFRGTSAATYDGLHLVTAVSGNTFQTNRKYVSDVPGNFYSVIGDMTLENVTIGDRVHNPSGALSGIIAHRLLVNRCDFRGYNQFAVGLENDLSALANSAYERIEIKNSRLESNDATTAPWVLAWDTGNGTSVGQVLNSDVIRMSGIDVVDVGASGATRGVIGNSARVKALTASATLTAQQSGTTFFVNSPDLTLTLPASDNSSGTNTTGVGAGVTYTFILGSAGLSTGTGLQISPNSSDMIVLAGVSEGVDNKDLILPGATDRVGDSVTIMSDGGNGWRVLQATQGWKIQDDTDVYGIHSPVLTSNVVDVGNVGTGEDDLITYSMPANTLEAEGHSLEIDAGFSLAANANSKTLKMYLGANELLGLAGAAQNDGSYYVRIVVIRDAVNTAKVVVYGGTHGGSGTPLGNVLGNAFVQPSVDFSTALTIKGTGEATSDNDVVMEFLRVRKVPYP